MRIERPQKYGRFEGMTFDECYERVILPTYERLKEEHERISIGHNAHIHTTRNMHCIDFTVMEGEGRVLSWRLKIRESKDEIGYLLIFGDALRSNCAAGHLTIEVIAVDKLTPYDIEFKLWHANALLGQTDRLETLDKLKAMRMRRDAGK